MLAACQIVGIASPTCVPLFVVNPHGLGRLKTEAGPRPRDHSQHFAPSNHLSTSQAITISLIVLILSLSSYIVAQQWNLSVDADLGGTAASGRLWKSRRLLDHAKEGFLLYSFAISAGAESLRSERLVIKGSPAIVLWPLDKTQYATLCRRISLRTSTTSQVGSRTEAPIR